MLLKETTRAWLYRVLLAASPLLAIYGVMDNSEIALWLGVAAAVTGNGLAVLNTNTARQWVYGIALAAQPVAVFYGLMADAEAALWVGIIGTMIGNGLATKNSSTS